MKKYIFILSIAVTLWSCGGSGGGSTPPTPEPNKAPGKAALSKPANNSLCIDNVQTFSWSAATDPDGDTVSYEIQLANNNTFSQGASTQTSNTTSKEITLDKGKAIYWRVRAKDSKGAFGEYSDVFQLYTEGDGVTNHLPFLPQVVSPALNSALSTASTNLEWTASDADTGDTLTFDVYFGESNPPTTKVGDNISATTQSVNLTSGKTYYWYVLVKDNNNGETKGQVWNFKTD